MVWYKYSVFLCRNGTLNSQANKLCSGAGSQPGLVHGVISGRAPDPPGDSCLATPRRRQSSWTSREDVAQDAQETERRWRQATIASAETRQDELQQTYVQPITHGCSEPWKRSERSRKKRATFLNVFNVVFYSRNVFFVFRLSELFLFLRPIKVCYYIISCAQDDNNIQKYTRQ